MIFDQQLLQAPVLAHDELDLDAAQRVTYLLEQNFTYDYDHPIKQLRHRLVVLPPPRHGNQYRRAHRLEIAGAHTRRDIRRDVHGNTVVRLRAERVERGVVFRIEALLERMLAEPLTRLPAAALTDPRLLRVTRLTAPDEQIREVAAAVAAEVGPSAGQLELAASVCRRVHAELHYDHGVTTVATTAAAALAGGRGVCQDAAHVMLALCHVLRIPARYVSGHLLGQGGTHAWVEVLIRDGSSAVAMPFDPCNGVPGSARYLTVATGRDYRDVAPTSGSYVGAAIGRLTTNRRVAVLAAA